MVKVVIPICAYIHYVLMGIFRYLEAEGTEKTFRFKQEDIAAAVPVANSQQVCGERQLENYCAVKVIVQLFHSTLT